ncbi:MAG: alpha/beta fold hydrolase [Planctomycetes bacterium]|nr:alpha/beta fold hydrolase [Planctomycetota bacterium]
MKDHSQPKGPPHFYADKANLLMYLDPEGRARPVNTWSDWAIRHSHILANIQLVMGPLPDADRRVPLNVDTSEEESFPGFVRRKILFSPEAEDRVPAYLLVPHGLKGKSPAMLCLHPTHALGKGRVVEGEHGRQYAMELAERGYVTLAPDYPGFGEYACNPYAMGYASTTMKAIWNHLRAVDVLQAVPEVDGERIGVIGHSLGGHNAMFAAVFEPRLKAVVSSGGFNSFSKYCGGNLWGWSQQKYMPRVETVYGMRPERMPFDFTEVVGALAPRPFYVNAPLHDDNMEVSGVRDCIAAAQPIYDLMNAGQLLRVAYPDAGHDFPIEQRREAYAFLDEALGATT